MLTFVLGGGGTRGAAQAGALHALIERGIVPELVVGTSVGSINAAQIAAYPTIEGTLALEESWRVFSQESLVGNSRRSAAWRTVRGKPSMYSNEHLRQFISKRTPPDFKFASLDMPLYIVASELYTGRPYIFGDNPREKVLDAIMASTAIPPYFPPAKHNNVLLVDGSVSAAMPLRIAIQRGATEIYAIDISMSAPKGPRTLRVWTVTELAIGAMLRQQMRSELAWARLQPGVIVHHLRIPFRHATGTWEMEAVDEFIQLGYQHATTFLIRRALPHGEKSVYRTASRAGGIFRRVANAVFRAIAFPFVSLARLLVRSRNADILSTDVVEDDIDDDIESDSDHDIP